MFPFKAHASIHALHHRIYALKPYPGTFKKCMKTAFTKKIFSVEIGNGVCDNKTLLKSAGIGLKIVDAMIADA